MLRDLGASIHVDCSWVDGGAVVCSGEDTVESMASGKSIVLMFISCSGLVYVMYDLLLDAVDYR